ncbi:uncharacterized protein [Dermacentor albipictus]|uniref:uncharacterized protein n=1 Tax=Dermacentor albipictus TaxID=60249 RepID=UPI0038FCF7ED
MVFTRRTANASEANVNIDTASEQREGQRRQELQRVGETESETSDTEMDSEAQGAAQSPSTTDPEAMAVRRLELELEKVRLQLECERIALRRVELEQSSRPPSVSEGSDRRGAITDGIAQCAKVLKAYRLPCDADVPIWFEEVEKLFSSFQVPEHSRVHLIMPALTERVRYLLRSLNDEECTDYETVKKAVLDELKLTPAEYLGRFEKASKRKEETWAQFASRARTYLAYYLQSRTANTKEAMTELMVADRMKASLSSEALEYVLLREGEDWFKPVEVAKVLETFEQAKGKGRATKPAATASLPQRAKLAGPQRTNLRCHVCHIQGHLARDCPKASDKEPQGKPPTVQKQRVQKVAVVSEEPPPEQERVPSARVHVVAQNASSGRSKLDLIPIMCGDIATEAVLDTGSEITVVRKSMLPIDLQEPSRTVRLESAFGNTIRAKLATLPVGMHRPGAVIQPQRMDLVCAVTDELANGVDCLLSKEDWELLRAQEKEEFGEENIPRAGVRSVEMVDNTEPDCGLSFEETTEQMPKLQENSFIQDVTGVPSQRELELAESVAELTGTECQSKHALVYNRRARTKEFNVGDQVLLFDTGWATKIAAIEGLVPPHTKKELRSLLGLCGHYRDYVSNYADVASPLTALTRRGVPNSIPWSEEAQCAFESLKLALCQAVAMNTPEPHQPYWLFTDASATAAGACLAQMSADGEEKPIAFASHRFNPTQARWSTIEREAFAIVWALKKFDYWLFGAVPTGPASPTTSNEQRARRKASEGYQPIPQRLQFIWTRTSGGAPSSNG